MNLESQVGHASDLISARVTTSDIPNDGLQSLSEKVEEIFRKLAKLENSNPVNNIVINSCSHGHAQSNLSHHSSTHTDSSTIGSNIGMGQGSNDSSLGSHTDKEQESSQSTSLHQDIAPQEQAEL